MPLQSLFGTQNSSGSQTPSFSGQWNTNVDGGARLFGGQDMTSSFSGVPGLNFAKGMYGSNQVLMNRDSPNDPSKYNYTFYDKNQPFDPNTLNWSQDLEHEGMDWGDMLKGAAIIGGGLYGANSLAGMFGGTGLGAGTAAASAVTDPMAAYLTSGAAEGSTLLNGITGAGGAAGAVGSGTTAGTLGSILSNPIAQQAGKKMTGNIVGNLVSNVLGGGQQPGGVSTLGNLASMFTNYNQYSQNKDILDQIKSIYSPDGTYAKYLQNELGRKDAAAGRNSQYGPRLAQMLGMLGEKQADALRQTAPFLQGSQGGMNGMVGAGSRLLQNPSLQQWISQQFGGNGGGMLAGELGSTPGLWDRASDDVDWSSLWGG